MPVSATEIDIGNTSKPQVALTFDAGGEVAPAPQILSILNKRGVHATWFFTGSWAEQNPEIVRHVADSGYEIGNHTVTHPDLTTLTNTQVCKELTQAEKIISAIAGRTTRPYFRPPFGARNLQVRQLAANLGYRTVYWTIDTLDWQTQSTADSIIQRISGQLTNGAIILMHAGSSSEVQALDRVITLLQQKGYQLVTLTQIVQGT
jgi:peptidoglycan/xylan/chitin deacetylase (PgdA/CDA1 family)